MQAVRGVALTIGSGEVMAFLGPNGAGKTSTIDMILGQGRIVADGTAAEVKGRRGRSSGGTSLLVCRIRVQTAGVEHFAGQHPDVCLLRASGDETEMLLDWGVTNQLLASAGPGSPRAGTGRPHDDGPLAVGAQLVTVLGDLQAGDRVVLVVVDDLHWCDQPSAQAILFALRRMQADRVLGLISARPDELSRLGDGWSRFAGGDHRATRLRLGGLSAADLVVMAGTLGSGALSARAATQLLEHTGGNALHCRSLLEEFGPGPTPSPCARPSCRAAMTRSRPRFAPTTSRAR